MANNNPQSTGIWKKRIPTLVGLLLLVGALVAGTVFFQDGLGVFAPRATPETTPKKVRVTNVSDTSFTVSFLTDESTSAFVKHGTDPKKLEKTQADDRDQLSGTIKDYKTHHLTVAGLQPNSVYYYVIGTGNGATFDNEGNPFTVTTARRVGTPAAAKTIYGSVTTESGAPASGAIVYVAIEGTGEISSLVTSSGSWAVPLSNARTADKAGYAEITDTTLMQIFVQGPETSRTAQGAVLVKDAQPVPTIAYGQTNITPVEDEQLALSENEADAKETDESDDATNLTASSEANLDRQPMDVDNAPPASNEAQQALSQTDDLDSTPSAQLTAAERTLFIEEDASASGSTEIPSINTTQPIVSGTAAPGVIVTIEIHSDTNISQQLVANPDGSFSLDVAQLSQQLEPGEHTVTYSYIDPNTGEKVTKTQTFIVEDDAQSSSTQLAQANPTTSATPVPTATPLPTATPQPYSSENPFPIGDATRSATATTDSTTGGIGATGSGITADGSSTSTTISTTSSTRVSNPATAGGVPVSGSVGTTLTLIFGGLFFITSGAWSFWASKQFND